MTYVLQAMNEREEEAIWLEGVQRAFDTALDASLGLYGDLDDETPEPLLDGTYPAVGEWVVWIDGFQNRWKLVEDFMLSSYSTSLSGCVRPHELLLLPALVSGAEDSN